MRTGQEHKLARQARREQRKREKQQQLRREWAHEHCQYSEKIGSSSTNLGVVSSARQAEGLSQKDRDELLASPGREKPGYALGSAQAQTWYMASPESPSEQSRRLLQAIWDLSWSRRGKRAEWPTLAALCHSEAAYPRFRAGEVEALLAQIPAGFINGIGPDGHRKPGDSQELSLTVAGVAGCRDTEKILALFLQFIQHAVALGTSFRNSGAGYLISDAKFIRYDPTLPKRPRRRDELLQQLHLILASEPGLWVHISGYDRGDWEVTFGRHIRYFKGIRNLDDYWACRFKPWESSDQVPYPVVAASNTRDQASRPQLLRDHPDLLADVLLRRILDCCGGLTSVVSCPKVDPDIDPTLIRQALRRLEAQGRIRLPNVDTSPQGPGEVDDRTRLSGWFAVDDGPRTVLTSDGRCSGRPMEPDIRAGSARTPGPCTSPGLPEVMLTSDGAGYISALRLYWDDRMLRRGAARNALLAWLYDGGIDAKATSDIYEIFSDPRSFYGGQFFSVSDIDDAASYLQEKNLIDGTSFGGKRITASGTDCIEQGGDVAEYGKQHHVEAKGDVVMGDKYEARGRAQVGTMGKGAKVTTVSFNSPAGEVREVDLASLISELQSLRAEMRNQASTTEDDQAVVAVGQAISAAEQGNTSSLFAHLKSAGKWALDLATAIGAELAAAALKSVVGF